MELGLGATLLWMGDLDVDQQGGSMSGRLAGTYEDANIHFFGGQFSDVFLAASSICLFYTKGTHLYREKIVLNIFLESQFSVADDGSGPDWRLLFSLDMQFK